MLATGLAPVPESAAASAGLPGAPHVTPAPPSSSEFPANRPPIEGDKTVRLDLRVTDDPITPAARASNERRSTRTLKLFGLLLFIMLDCFAAFACLLYNYFQQNIEPRLNPGIAAAAAVPASVEKPPSEDLKAALTASKDQIAKLQAQIEALRIQQTSMAASVKVLSEIPVLEDASASSTKLSLADVQVSRLQTQVNELRAQQSQADVLLKKLDVPTPKTEDSKTTETLAAATKRIDDLQTQVAAFATQQTQTEAQLKKLAEKPAPPTPDPSATARDARISTVVTVNSEAGTELRLLKERNRLTLYADQALANASSLAMANLWQTLRDPDLAFVKDGAVAEIVRVQHFYGSMRSLPPTYHLPVEELFKGTSVHAEADLKDQQVIDLLLDEAQPPEIRTRAAMMLSGHRDKSVGDALVHAMRHDANLMVVKAAQNTLQDNFELYAPRLFDAIGMEKAWEQWLAKNEKTEAKGEK